MKAMDRIDVIMPMYNEEAVLPDLFARLNVVLPEIEAELGVRFSMIFVDDGSRDATVTLAQELPLNIPARMIQLSRNFGKEAALTAGLDAAEGDATVVMDADLQHPLELLRQMVLEWRAGAEVVFTYKKERRPEGLAKLLLARVFYRMVNAESRFSIPMDAQDFRLLDRRVVEALRRLPESQRMMRGLFAWVGFRQVAIPLDSPARVSGLSKFSALRLLGLAIDGVTSFTIAPIRYLTLFGLFTAFMSFVYLFYVIIERLIFGSPFSGFASIVVLITFFGGLNLIGLGVIGEYVGKAVIEAKARPVYIVSREIALGSDSDASE